MTLIEIHMIYGLAWISFGVGHSFLASAKAKHMLEPKLGPYYRITYNAIASGHIFAIWLLGLWLFDGSISFPLPKAVATGLTGLSIFGTIIFAVALKGYDLGLLAGTAQIRNHKMGITKLENEPLHTDGLHSYVRHPIYLGAYLMLWGGIQNDHGLATAIWASIYLTIGTMFEERYLMKLYGEAYRTYRDKVPSIFPWRGKAL